MSLLRCSCLIYQVSIRRGCKHTGSCVCAFLLIVLLVGCGCIRGPGILSRDRPQIGTASWYGRKYHGRRTSNGEIFDMYKLTAAHKKLPFGTIVRVTNLKNGRSVIVKINDRGPWKRGRIIDLSYGAAKKIGMVKDGVTKVKVEIIKR